MSRVIGLQDKRVSRPEVSLLKEGLSAEELANLLSLSYEPMLAWRLDGTIEFWNAGAEKFYGFSPDEAVEHSSHVLLQTKFPIPFAELLLQLRSVNRWSGDCAISARTGAK